MINKITYKIDSDQVNTKLTQTQNSHCTQRESTNDMKYVPKTLILMSGAIQIHRQVLLTVAHMHNNYSTLFSFRSLFLTILFITMVHGFKAPSTKNVDELLDLNGHINTKSMLNPKVPHVRTLLYWNQYCLRICITLNYHVQCLGLLPLPVCLHKNWITNFASICRDFENNLTTQHAKLVDDNDHKSYDVRQWVLTYPALLKLCMDELTDCKSQIN